ncbi:MAG: sigma-54-dependent transcriptional regulator [Akkermansiaceae bacterium]
MKELSLLIVEDNQALALALSARAERSGFMVRAVPSLARARIAIDERVPDGIILDLGLPDGRGLELARYFEDGEMPVTALLTAHGEIEHAIEAKKLGVREFFVKPVDFSELEEFFEKVMSERGSLPAGGDYVFSESVAHEFSMSFIGTSSAMRVVFQDIAKACASSGPVLVRGGVGSGRSHVAHLISQNWESEGRTIFLQCGDFNGDWEAVVGAVGDGCVVLDEVHTLALVHQVGLNSAMARYSGVKWIALCGEEGLLPAVQDHYFHLDLYYNLQGVEVILPALSERRSDFGSLCALFLAELSPSQTVGLSDEAYTQLVEQEWPGNLGELRRALKYALISARNTGKSQLDLADFPEVHQLSSIPKRSGFERSLELWVEKELVNEDVNYRDISTKLEGSLLEILLERYEGNQAALARSLSMNRATLRKKLSVSRTS